MLHLSLANLLNPSDAADQGESDSMMVGTVDIRPQLQDLHRFPTAGFIRAPLHIQQSLLDVIEYLDSNSVPSAFSASPSAPSPAYGCLALEETTEEYDVQLTKKTKLLKLYRHLLRTVLEYPQTSDDDSRPIGHLFLMDPDNWEVPDHNIVYSWVRRVCMC
jgi:hypothetical protein